MESSSQPSNVSTTMMAPQRLLISAITRDVIVSISKGHVLYPKKRVTPHIPDTLAKNETG